MSGPRPGDLWVVDTGNNFVSREIKHLTKSTVDHAGIWGPDGTIGEAMPDGFQVVPNHYSGQITIPLDLTDDERTVGVGPVLAAMRGTPYNFVDIADLGLALELHIHTPEKIKERLSSPGHMICSQAADWFALAFGIHLFADGRLAGQVTPGDLLLLAQASTAVSSPA